PTESLQSTEFPAASTESLQLQRNPCSFNGIPAASTESLQLQRNPCDFKQIPIGAVCSRTKKSSQELSSDVSGLPQWNSDETDQRQHRHQFEITNCLPDHLFEDQEEIRAEQRLFSS